MGKTKGKVRGNLREIHGKFWGNQGERCMNFLKKHPVVTSAVISCVIGIIYSTLQYIWSIIEGDYFSIEDLLYVPLSGALVGMLIMFPICLVIGEVYFLIAEGLKKSTSGAKVLELTLIYVGIIYEYAYVALFMNATSADWPEQLHNAERHTPIYTEAMPTVVVIFALAILGYCVLQFVKIEKLPPLAVVLSMSAMYLGVVQIIVLTIQLFSLKEFMFEDASVLTLLLLPEAVILITIRTILIKIREYKELSKEMSRIEGSGILSAFWRLLERAEMWPVIALFMMVPLLGILIMVLLLFGQAPDSVVKAWTETSDWTLSTKVSPQNIYYDEHYLCTVAAGGHRKVVKPIRMGKRHGRDVIVNRQLCIANAFEEVIQEKTPRLHKVVREIYDKYGFPVARIIKKRWIADVIYFLMKPLEWLFLAVLYLTDVHPENRIAVQYMGKVPRYRH